MTLWARQQKNFQQCVVIYTYLFSWAICSTVLSKEKLEVPQWGILLAVLFWRSKFDGGSAVTYILHWLALPVCSSIFIVSLLVLYEPLWLDLRHSMLVRVLQNFHCAHQGKPSTSHFIKRHVFLYTEKCSYMIDNRKTKKGKIIF